MKLPFQDSDPAHWSFQYLEDISTAYWYSEVLFAALDLNLFEHIELESGGTEAVARKCGCDPHGLGRLLRAMKNMELVQGDSNCWFNSQIVRRHLLKTSEDYIGDFLIYRRFMQRRWKELVPKILLQNLNTENVECEDYQSRTVRYVQAMDQVILHKAKEIRDMLSCHSWEGPILDVGGGAGSLGRSLLKMNGSYRVTLFELPEVIEASQRLYPETASWERINVVAGDFRTADCGSLKSFGLIILSNFLHAYGPAEAQLVLNKAITLLRDDGLVVIHDYFPDRPGNSPHKGALYDINMMLNTYDGECHESSRICEWLRDSGIEAVAIRDLQTDTSVMIGAHKAERIHMDGDAQFWSYTALELGFKRAVMIPIESVVVDSWVQVKCKFGCAKYGQSLQCPPYSMQSCNIEELFKGYSKALLVEDSPPGKDFHRKLLDLERKAFLAGYHKALAFGAGPCTLCSQCPDDGICRYPHKARPSMEASGIDVYATVRRAGFKIEPVRDKTHYVKYFGLLILE